MPGICQAYLPISILPNSHRLSNVTDMQSSGEHRLWMPMSYKHCIMFSLHQKPGLWPRRCWDAQRDCCMPSAPGAFADSPGPIR